MTAKIQSIHDISGLPIITPQPASTTRPTSEVDEAAFQLLLKVLHLQPTKNFVKLKSIQAILTCLATEEFLPRDLEINATGERVLDVNPYSPMWTELVALLKVPIKAVITNNSPIFPLDEDSFHVGDILDGGHRKALEKEGKYAYIRADGASNYLGDLQKWPVACKTLLEEGGVLQFTEIIYDVESPEDLPTVLSLYLCLFEKAALKLGYNTKARQPGYIKQWCESAGFTDIEEDIIPVNLDTSEMGDVAGRWFKQSLQVLGLDFITKAFDFPEANVVELLEGAMEALSSVIESHSKYHAFIEIIVVRAEKPRTTTLQAMRRPRRLNGTGVKPQRGILTTRRGGSNPRARSSSRYDERAKLVAARMPCMVEG